MKKEPWTYWLCIAICLTLGACSGGSSGGEGEIDNSSYTVEGVAQKGPFLIGSIVDVSALSATGQALDSSLTTQTTDSLGNFSFTRSQAGPVLITVSGYHYNELTGHLSDGQLTLRGIVDVNQQGEQTANINIMTHLIHTRVQALMAGGVRVSDAMSQAKQEWLDSFAGVISSEQTDDFSQLDIFAGTGSGEGHDVLLLASVLFYQYATDLAAVEGGATEAKLAEILNNVAHDLGSDGDIDDVMVLEDLRFITAKIDAKQIIANLGERSRDLTGEAMPVPDISEFLNRIIIAFPAEDARLHEAVKVRTLGISPVDGVEYSLLVDGEPVAGLAADNVFDWAPYYWSADTNSRHTLAIRASNERDAAFSNVVNVTVLTRAASALAVESPSNERGLTNDVQPELRWTALPGAVTYRVQLAQTDNPPDGRIDPFANPLLDIETATPSTTAPALVVGRYVWRIRATDGLDHTGAWSPSYVFYIATLNAPNAESMTSAVTKVEAGQYTVALSWAPVSDAVAYQIEIARDSLFTNIVSTHTAEEGRYQLNLGVANITGESEPSIRMGCKATGEV